MWDIRAISPFYINMLKAILLFRDNSGGNRAEQRPRRPNSGSRRSCFSSHAKERGGFTVPRSLH